MAVHRQQPEAVDQRRHPSAVPGVRAPGVDADPVGVQIAEPHPVAEDQAGRELPGLVGCGAMGGAVFRIAHLDADRRRIARRDVDRRVVGEGDVDVLAEPVRVPVPRAGDDLRPVGAVGAGAALDPDLQNVVGISVPAGVLGLSPDEMALDRPAGLRSGILVVACGRGELGEVVVGASALAIEYKDVLGVRLHVRVGRRPPFVFGVVVQPSPREPGDMVVGAVDDAVEVAHEGHVAALVRVIHAQPDALQLVPGRIRAGPEALLHPRLGAEERHVSLR